MVKKFFIYLKSDGLKASINFAIKSITSFFYDKSETNLYYRKNAKVAEIYKDCNIRQMDISDVEKIDFPRLKLLPYKQWIDNGAKLYVVFVNGIPAAFSWVHFRDYKFTHGYKFKIGKNECWAGPQFVHEHYRGKGLQRIMVAHNIDLEKGNDVYTSVNVNNIASNKCMSRNNFELIGTITIITVFGRKIKTEMTAGLENKIQRQ